MAGTFGERKTGKPKVRKKVKKNGKLGGPKKGSRGGGRPFKVQALGLNRPQGKRGFANFGCLGTPY